MVTDAKRLQQIIKNLLSNAFKFTHQGQVTLTVEPVDGGWSRGQRGAEPRRPGAGVRGDRHRHRHLAGQAADHLRGVPAGRRLHQPQVRRHRPGPGDQPRAVAAAGRRDPPGRARRRRAARSRCTCRRPTARARGAPPGAAAAAADRPRRRRARPKRAAARGRSAPPASRWPRRRAEAEADGRAAVLANEADDDRDDIRPGDRVLLIVENDLGFARFLLDAARESGFKGLVSRQRRRRPGADARVQAGGHHARHLPARHRRLARPRAAEERPGDAAHPGLRDLDRRRARPGAGVRRARLPGQADPVERRWSTRRSTQLHQLRRARARASCWWLMPTSAAARRAARPPRRRRRRRSCVADERRRGARRAARRRHRLPGGRRPRGRPRPRGRGRRRWSSAPLAAAAAGRALRRRRRRRRRRPGSAATAASRCARRDSLERAARRTALLPAPRHGRACPSAERRAVEAMHEADTRAGRQEGADRRRRHAQHLRAGHGAGGARHGHRLGRQRPRRDPPGARTTRASTSC